MKIDKFKRKEIEFYLPDSFKGMSKKYIVGCMFNKRIQEKWIPSEGDVIVGCTGNIFVISCVVELSDSIGGTMYLFGGGLCNRDGGCAMDSTYQYTANKSGKYIHPTKGEILNLNHSCIGNFRYVPYPHEIDKML